MGFDVLCPICAIRPGGGPTRLIDSADLEDYIPTLVNQLHLIGPLENIPDEDKLKKILTDALKLASHDTIRDQDREWLQFRQCIAIGNFEEDGFPKLDDRDGLGVNGRDVTVRLVNVYDSLEGGDFDHWYDPQVPDVRHEGNSNCSPVESNPNVLISRCCQFYLREWIDWESLPDRSAGFPDDPEPMSMEGELYEILNTRDEERVDRAGILEEIDYDGLHETLEQYQDFFKNACLSPRHLHAALLKGEKSPHELLPAILEDFRVWFAYRTNIWPIPPQPDEKNPTTFPTIYPPPTTDNPNPNSKLASLSDELLHEILTYLPLISILNLSSTCKQLRSIVLNPHHLAHWLSIQTSHPSQELYWIMPIPSVDGDGDGDEGNFSEWIKEDNVFASPAFPHLTFVRACYSTESMRNRRRIWGIVKQFERIWRDYRQYGWKRVTLMRHAAKKKRAARKSRAV